VNGAGTFASSVTAGGIISTSGTGLNASVRINNTTSSTGKDWHLYSLNNGNFGLYNNTDGRYAYQVTPIGSLGLGVTPSAWTNQGPAIQIGAQGSISAIQYESNNNQVSIANNVYVQQDTDFYYIASNPAGLLRIMNSGEFQWMQAGSGNANAPITFTRPMTLDASGNVGIGTTSITNGTTFGGGGQINRLKVQSTNYTCLEINGSTSGGSVQFTYGTNLPNQVAGIIGYNYANGAANEFAISNILSGPLIFATSNTERMRIANDGDLTVGNGLNNEFIFQNDGTFLGGSGASSTIRLNYGGQTIARLANTGTGQRDAVFQLSDEGTTRVNISANASRGGDTYFNTGGRVGINTSTPTKLFHVSGGSAVLRVGPDYFAENGSADRDYIDLIADGSDTKIISPNETFSILNPTGNIDIISQGSGGVRLTPGATSWTGISDLRLKNINSEITNATSKLNTLRAVNFSWKSDETQRENLGLIAQDIEAVFPQIVDTDKDGLMGVRYTELIPVLVKAIQELKSENDNLKSRLEVLEQS
jgi:hypothetical protein